MHLSAWFYDYTGLAPSDAPDFTIARAVHPDDQERLVQDWNHAVSTGRPFRATFRLQHKDGEWEWFWSRGRSLGAHTGEQERWFGICVRLEDVAAMQLAGCDRLAATISGASQAASPDEGDDATEGPGGEPDPNGVRLTAAASYALAAGLLIEEGSPSALAKAQEVLSQLSRELVQLSHAMNRRRRRSA